MHEITKILKRAESIFITPQTLYDYEKIIKGVHVHNNRNPDILCRAVETNSFLYYQRNKLFPERILAVYQNWFIDNKVYLLENLTKARSKQSFEQVCENAFQNILSCLRITHADIEETVKLLPVPPKRNPPSLNSYNRVRKIIDLYIEHIVAMTNDLTSNDRRNIVPLLSLPLDSQIFSDPDIFSDAELIQCKLSRKWNNERSNFSAPGYGALKLKSDYFFLQNNLIKKCDTLEVPSPFFPIYFDLKWSRKDNIPRYCSQGNNLFETNFGTPIS